jgi:hypothetical protein
MNVKLVVAILLIPVVPVCAQAQSPSAPKVNKGDAQKVVRIISGDKAKTQIFCDMKKLTEQIEEASAKKDGKTVRDCRRSVPTARGVGSRDPRVAATDHRAATRAAQSGAISGYRQDGSGLGLPVVSEDPARRWPSFGLIPSFAGIAQVSGVTGVGNRGLVRAGQRCRLRSGSSSGR